MTGDVLSTSCPGIKSEACARQLKDGGCGGKPSTLSGNTLTVPANTKSVNVESKSTMA